MGDLANVFEGLGLGDAVDMIYNELERDVLQGNRVYHPHMLLDLAERHQSKGRKEVARRFWKLACAERAGGIPTDPRTRTRFYHWHYDAEPAVCADGFRVEQAGSGANIEVKFASSRRACCWMP